MPFIRYFVGDIGIPSDDECSCGITLPLMKMIEGRKDSLLILPDGRLLSPRTFTVAMNMFKSGTGSGEIDQFRVIQRKTDLFEIHVKTKSEAFDEKSMEQELVGHLKNVLNLTGNDVAFEIKFGNRIPLDATGKFSAVVSMIKANPS
jgi:phenylacetate-CoA ligase